MMLPMIMRIRIRDGQGKGFGIWFPLVVLYVLLIPVYVILAIAYALMLVMPSNTSEARSGMLIVFYAPLLLGAARGTEIKVHSNESDILVKIV